MKRQPATTRRWALILALSLLAAACGGGESGTDDGGPETTTTAAADTTAAAAESAVAAAEPTTITVTDGVDRTVTVELPVERAVVLNSYGNEFVRAIGAGDRVVGVDQISADRVSYGDFQGKVIAENLTDINFEAVVALDPDVFIAPRNAAWQEAADQLEPFGIPVVVASAWDFDAFHFTIDLLGQVFQTEERAAEVSAFYDEIFNTVAERVAGEERVDVYWETVEYYLTVQPGSGFHSIIEAAGGNNIFGDLGAADNEVFVEPAQILERNPAVVVHEFEPAATPSGSQRFDDLFAELLGRPGWDSLQAVENGDVYVSNGWATSGFGKAIGVAYLGRWLHPEKFEDVDPEEYLRRWVEEFQGTEFLGEAEYIQKAG